MAIDRVDDSNPPAIAAVVEGIVEAPQVRNEQRSLSDPARTGILSVVNLLDTQVIAAQDLKPAAIEALKSWSAEAGRSALLKIDAERNVRRIWLRVQRTGNPTEILTSCLAALSRG